MIRIKYLSGMNFSLYMYKSCKQNVIMHKIYSNHGTYTATLISNHIQSVSWLFPIKNLYLFCENTLN